MDLNGAVGIVTGASSGIGAACARELSATGMKLLVTARRGERLEELASELGDATPLAADMGDADTPQRLIDTAISAYGRCDVVVNNAGIMEAGTVEDIDIDQVCKMVRINVEAAYRLIYVAAKYFRSAGTGHLVNVSSVLGTKVRPTAGAYAGTKYAIEALSEALRMELAGSGIKVSCVEPGLVMTELHDGWEVHPKELLGIDPPLEPSDIARSVKFVLEQPDSVVIPRIMVLPAAHGI
jgi:NADP-dependent 3-hydroxy acid dehydrogenase YdfG